MIGKIPIPMLALFLLICLPLRIKPKHLRGLAFFLWFAGGIVLTLRGIFWLFNPQTISHQGIPYLLTLGLMGLGLGFFKGKFILSRASARNLERLDKIETPQKPIYVYTLKTWLFLCVMFMLAISFNVGWIPLKTHLRGALNFAIGSALIWSSFTYLPSSSKKRNLSTEEGERPLESLQKSQ